MYAAVWILWSLKNFIIKKISIIKKNSLLSGVVRMFGGYHSLAQDIFVPLILIKLVIYLSMSFAKELGQNLGVTLLLVYALFL